MSASFAEASTAAASVWFVSDVHLRHGDRPYLDQFLSFLDTFGAESAAGDELWIVGDLFEFWIGDRQAADGFYDDLFARLRALTGGGRPVRVVHGNRDFLMGRAFRKAGCELMADQNLLRLGQDQVHVSHGDELCVEDLSYQRARVVMRSRPARWAAAAMPGWLGGWLARRYRGISERSKAKKKERRNTGNRFHTIEKGLSALVSDRDPDVVICGHIHYPRDQRLDLDGRTRRVITTGAWEEGPNYVIWSGETFALREFRP